MPLRAGSAKEQVIRAAALRRWGADLPAATMKLSDHLGYMWRDHPELREVHRRHQAPVSPFSL